MTRSHGAGGDHVDVELLQREPMIGSYAKNPLRLMRNIQSYAQPRIGKA